MIVAPFDMGPRMSKGGIIVAEGAEGVQIAYGTILKIGPKVPEGFEFLAEGDNIIHPAHKGISTIQDGENQVRLMPIDAAYAVLEEE